ncbi:MAG: PAS domain-containing protein [Alphaproteobacteria bacterium]|nr:PAS domain-containing protein [Alphaproteobacteria bacterium]
MTDQRGEMVWSAQSTMGPALLRQIHDPAVTGGVVHDWAAPDGTLHTIGFARAPRSGLTVVVAQPTPGLYERVPFGPAGAVGIAIGVTLLSFAMARLGAGQIIAAYQAAIRGTRAGLVRIDEAVRLGVELRSRRDRLFHAAGGIAVAELTRPPGRGWGEAEIVASENLRVMMELAPGEALTVERLTRNLLPGDRAALAATLAGVDAQASVFTRLVRTEREGHAPRYFNLVGMLHEDGPDEGAQLVLTLQDVTAQKVTELEVEAQASRLLLATEIAGLGVWERDPLRNTIHVSERLWEIMGLAPRPEIAVDVFLAAVHPDDRAGVTQAFRVRQPEETGAPGVPAAELRYRIVRPDGGVRHVRSRRVFVEDAGGRGTRVVGVLIDETEAVMAQRALAASEARFRLAVDVAELGVFERFTGPNSNVGVWNERMWRIRGLAPRAEPMGYDELVAMVHPDDRPRVIDAMDDRRRNIEGASDYEFRLIRPDGEERIVQSRSVRTYLPEDNAVSIVAINLDVTERRLAEQGLAESAARFQLAVETAELGFAQLDPATGKGMWNDRLFHIYGLAPRAERPSIDEVLSHVHPEDRDVVVDAMARQHAGKGGDVTETEFRIVRADGQERIIHVRSVRLLRADGSETLSTVTQDVTERRRAVQALADSEMRFRLAVETAELGVVDRNLATGEGNWSPQMWRIMGMEAGAHPLGQDESLSIVHPDDRALVEDIRARHAAGKVGDTNECEFRMVRPDGQVRVLHARSVTLLGSDGVPRLLAVNQDVTEQRQAERALADSEWQLRLAVETARLGVADRNLTTGEGSWSAQLCRIMGMEPDGKPLSNAETLAPVHPDDRAQVEAVWARANRSGDGLVSEYEYRMMRPDGEARILHARSVSLRGADGAVRLLSVNQDVTERRRAEQALADSEMRLRLAVDAAGLGIWDYDKRTDLTVWSDLMWRIRGLEPATAGATRQQIRQTVVEEDHGILQKFWDRIDAEAEEISYEYRVRRPDGAIRHVSGLGRLVRDGRGEVVRVVGVSSDITERRLAELRVAESELRLRLATEVTGVGIWDHDPVANTTIWNDQMFRLRGLVGQGRAPERASITDHTLAEDRPVLLGAWDRLKSGETALGFEYRVVWPDGTVRWLHSEGRSLYDAQGRLVRMLGLVTDVTAEREAAIALLDRTATLELAIEAADLGVWVCDIDGDVRECSARVWSIFGQPGRVGAMTSAEMYAGIHPEDREVIRQDWLPTRGDGMPRRREYRTLWADGTIRHVLSHRAVQRDPTGAVVRVIGVMSDVTEARRSAAALVASEARLRLAVEAAELGVLEYDPVTREGYWSEELWRMRGLVPRAGLPTHEQVIVCLHPDDRQAAEARIQSQFSAPDGTRLDGEFRVVWPDGSMRHILLRAVLHRGADGTARVFGINLDVTERRTAAQALEASEARLRLAVEAAEMGVFEFDPESRTGHWSERIWQMRGLEPQPGTLSFEQVIALVHPADRESVAARMRQQFAAPDGERGEYEFRIVRPDGAVRYILSRAVTQRRRDGGLHRLFGINIDITERRLAAQALEESEARLRVASEAAALGVFQVNMPEGAGHWSDQMWRIRGLEPRPGLPGSDLAVATVHPEDRDVVRGLRKAAASWPHGEAMRQQFRLVWPDGTQRHVASYAVALHGREEGGFSLVGVNLDITEQVEREQALRESAARFELAIDAAGLAVWDWDTATERMTWSQRLWAMAGSAPRAEVPAPEERLQAVHPEDRGRVPLVWIHATNAGESERGEDEFRVILRDGTIRYFRWQGIPLRDAQGRIVRFAGVVADVTEARLADLALRTSEELFRMAAEAAEQGVWNHDLATGAITWSARLWRMHGLPPQEGAPEPEKRIAFIHSEDREELLRLTDEVLALLPNTVMRRTYRILRADGAVRTLDRQSMLVAGADGQPARIVCVVHDVTEARELAAQTMVADKLATLGEMAGAIAHELAQPLQAVMATAATARMRLAQAVDEATVERVSDRLAWIEKQTSRAGKTIQHLLAFSRGESSEGLCRLADALEGAMELAGHGLRRDGVEVSVEVPADLPPVHGGQVVIEQVLVNLLNNARDAMAESPERRIRIEARQDGDLILLDVADTGSGVPADKLERIFEPFYTTKPVGRGTGIGLSVARRTMQALGGGITVANTGRGACFSLTFRNAATGG